MNQLSISSFTSQPVNPVHPEPGGMRLLTNEEIALVSGGVLPLIPPVVVAGVQWGSAIFGGAVLASAGRDFYEWLVGPDDVCSM